MSDNHPPPCGPDHTSNADPRCRHYKPPAEALDTGPGSLDHRLDSYATVLAAQPGKSGEAALVDEARHWLRTFAAALRHANQTAETPIVSGTDSATSVADHPKG